LDAVTSSTDTTADRVLKVGAGKTQLATAVQTSLTKSDGFNLSGNPIDSTIYSDSVTTKSFFSSFGQGAAGSWPKTSNWWSGLKLPSGFSGSASIIATDQDSDWYVGRVNTSTGAIDVGYYKVWTELNLTKTTSSTDTTSDRVLLTQYAYASDSNNYHTGNVGALTFNNPPDGTQERVNINSNAITEFSRTGTASTARLTFVNGNGLVGSIFCSGTSTQFNTSSDNRLKENLGKPTDEQVNDKFNDIFDTFTLFNWKNGGNSEPVWGFLAHDVEDKGLDFASVGEGPRDLEIGEVYKEAVIDETGNILEPEKVVTPYGVDQSKVVPYLVAKIEQQDRLIQSITKRLDDAGL